ncbi:hypothetical protein Q6348_15270 [Isoptericola sp. b441]|uniref:Glycosyltransferase RgtA/B/C/D-like domain-containing protein n=1 Tax=Actinotalea lenta TaxID=3064654 RepID=A0ABT9DCG1_9CELL|nr:hypothetical protein [Isoptericola sp. b441]MDO8108557.1 hypothetical protein [Isoptericola sp. b441]
MAADGETIIDGDDSPPPVPPETTGPGPARERTWITAVVAVGLGLITVVIGTLGQLASPDLSPIDEHTHLGYAWDISHGKIPAAGDTIPPEILREWTCRGQFNLKLPPCDSTTNPADFVARGEQYNFAHPPVYYLVTGYLARAASVVGVTFVPAARFASSLWLAAGVVMLFFALRRWGVRTAIAAGIAATAVGTPWVLGSGTTVTNDAPAILGGAFALLVAARLFREERYGLWVPVLLTALAASTKTLNAYALLAVAGVAVIYAVLRRRTPQARPLAVVGLSIVATVAVVYFAWDLFQSHRGDPNWVSPIAGFSTDPIVGTPLAEWTSTFFQGLQMSARVLLDPDFTGLAMTFWTPLATALVTSGAFVALFRLRPSSRAFTIPAATLVGLLTYPTVVQLQAFVNTSGAEYFPDVSSRYGLSLVPLILACWAIVLERVRGGTWAAVALGGAGTLAVLAAVSGISHGG